MDKHETPRDIPVERKGRRSRTTQERRDEATAVFTHVLLENTEDAVDTLDPLGVVARGKLAESLPAVLLLPNSAQIKILQRDINLRPYVTNEFDRHNILKQMIEDMLERYRDVRFQFGGETMWKEDYGRIQMVRWAKEVVDADPWPESLQKLAWLSFDANGLKAINDLSGSHENGTEYLRMIAEIFFDESLREELRERYGVTDLLVTSGGGDEFSVMLRSDKSFSDASLQQIVEKYEAKIEETRDRVARLIDFTKEETKIRFLGYTEDEFYDDARVSPARREQLLASIPADFCMRASGQGGWATLAQGLQTSAQAKVDSKRISRDDRPTVALRKIMGGAIDDSDELAGRRKKMFKKNLKKEMRPDGTAKTNTEREHDAYYGEVLSRTTEVRILLRQLDEIDEAIASCTEAGGSCDSTVQKITEIRSKAAA